MRVKLRMIGDKLDSSEMLINAGKLQLGTKIYTEKFPLSKDIGILTIIEGMKEEENLFQIVVKNSKDELLGKGKLFRARVMSKETEEAIVIYNINKTYFEDKDSFYIVELWNKENILDKFELRAENNIYNIYNNLDDKGVITLI